MSYDRSYKDKKYFIDGSTYNCPFCNRKNVCYTIDEYACGDFDSSNDKKSYYYLVRCSDCDKTSFHLSNYDLKINGKGFAFPPKQVAEEVISSQSFQTRPTIKDIIKNGQIIKELDELFFHHIPTANFTIDNRIPESIRKPLHETKNCLNNNFLTGASGCLRKAIYKLLQKEGIPEKDDNDKNLSSDMRIYKLKERFPLIDQSLFDDLKRVNSVTSKELHENDWEDLDSRALKLLITVTMKILWIIYVKPDEDRKEHAELEELRSKINS